MLQNECFMLFLFCFVFSDEIPNFKINTGSESDDDSIYWRSERRLSDDDSILSTSERRELSSPLQEILTSGVENSFPSWMHTENFVDCPRSQLFP